MSAAELYGRLGEVRLFDIRWSLTDPDHGVATYEKGHIPGAVFVDLDTDLSGPVGPGRHPLPEADAFAASLGRLGVSPEDEVVVYDDMGGFIAARMWWMLRSIRHESSRVLNGGFGAWVGGGLEVEAGNNTPEQAHYPAPDGFSGVVTFDQLDGRTLLDARAPERYRGDEEPVDPKAGHIPGALSRPAADNLEPVGLMKSPSDLSKLYAGLDGAIASCGSGVTACHDALAMVVAGMDMPDIYVGSFSDWSNRDLPVATGPKP